MSSGLNKHTIGGGTALVAAAVRAALEIAGTIAVSVATLHACAETSRTRTNARFYYTCNIIYRITF